MSKISLFLVCSVSSKLKQKINLMKNGFRGPSFRSLGHCRDKFHKQLQSFINENLQYCKIISSSSKYTTVSDFILIVSNCLQVSKYFKLVTKKTFTEKIQQKRIVRINSVELVFLQKSITNEISHTGKRTLYLSNANRALYHLSYLR